MQGSESTSLSFRELAIAEFSGNGFVAPDGGFWPYLVYDPESKNLLLQKDRPGLPTKVLMEHLQAIIRHSTEPKALARFHPLRPMAESMTGESLMFFATDWSLWRGRPTALPASQCPVQ